MNAVSFNETLEKLRSPGMITRKLHITSLLLEVNFKC